MCERDVLSAGIVFAVEPYIEDRDVNKRPRYRCRRRTSRPFRPRARRPALHFPRDPATRIATLLIVRF